MTLTLKELPVSERPRERLFTHGPRALSDAELLGILLRTGARGVTAVDLARGLLAEGTALSGHGLVFLAATSAPELARLPGIGRAKAAQLKAALELGRRLNAVTVARPIIRQPADAAAIVMEDMRHLDREHFQVILLDTKNHVLGVELISIGSLNSTIVHPREIFKLPIRRGANAIILVHNHPSGDPAPSPEDREVTQRLVEVGRLIGIEVLDHIIIGNGRFASLRESGAGW